MFSLVNVDKNVTFSGDLGRLVVFETVCIVRIPLVAFCKRDENIVSVSFLMIDSRAVINSVILASLEPC